MVGKNQPKCTRTEFLSKLRTSMRHNINLKMKIFGHKQTFKKYSFEIESKKSIFQLHKNGIFSTCRYDNSDYLLLME